MISDQQGVRRAEQPFRRAHSSNDITNRHCGSKGDSKKRALPGSICSLLHRTGLGDRIIEYEFSRASRQTGRWASVVPNLFPDCCRLHIKMYSFGERGVAFTFSTHKDHPEAPRGYVLSR